MAYRKIEKKKPVRRVLQDTAAPNRTYVQNGVTAHLAVPCWYMPLDRPQHTHLHDREWHDHIGWPRPGKPDDSCQDAYLLKAPPYKYDEARGGWHHAGRYLDMSKCTPIHLEREGYNQVDIAFADKPEGLTASGHIDDHVVRFSITPMCAGAVKEDLDVLYTVFVSGTVAGRKARDVVAKGVLHILAGPIE